MTKPSAQHATDDMRDLYTWWTDLADVAANRTVPKAIEYGSMDLQLLGETLRHTWGHQAVDEEPSLSTQAGIAFYALGKIERALCALVEGREPSADTWFDVMVYATMALRSQSAGSWPGHGTVPPQL